MGNKVILEQNDFFYSLEGRYKRFLLQKIKTYLENAGYKGLAFIYMLSMKSLLYKVYQETPLFKDIINSYEGAFLFDKRTAINQAVDTARKLQVDNGSIAMVADRDFVPQQTEFSTYQFWLDTLKNLGQEKVGYIPDPKDLLSHGVQQEDFVVKFLVRYYTLKQLIKSFEKHFNTDAILQETEKSKAGEKHERENEAVERIGRKYFPDLFSTDASQEQLEDVPEVDSGLEKHEWLGTQYHLAELYIELERKGWITKKLPKTIQASFTNSNTIQQVLKPGVDLREPTYPQVYKESYKPMFESIKQNKKNRK